jgi:hypothetical protein
MKKKMSITNVSHFKSSASTISVPNCEHHDDSEPEEEIDVVETDPDETT